MEKYQATNVEANRTTGISGTGGTGSFDGRVKSTQLLRLERDRAATKRNMPLESGSNGMPVS